MKKIVMALLAVTLLNSCKNQNSHLPDGLYAEIETNKGTIIVSLDYKNAPITVANFVSLAEGKNSCVNHDLKGKPFYDGLKFHRVIPNFMIQGGDPMGDGTGGAGYLFKDEINDCRFDKAGVLAMANSGPGTNSSQFFITHLETPWLEGRHTIFGKVVENGMETVNKIEPNDEIVKVTIIRNGDTAKKFDAVKVFSNYFSEQTELQKKQALIDAENKKLYDQKYKPIKDQKVVELESLRKTANKTSSGLQYKIIRKGNGKKPTPGSMVKINYAGFLENGELFDTCIESVAKTFGKLDLQRAAAKQYLPIPFEYGRKDGLIPGFIEGLEKLSFGDKAVLFIPSPLAYGAQGAGGVIPPNANIIFEIELIEK
ncbi:peptidylprolyl isomerase [Flavobacterium sp. CYK-4]|uniref:peptidylprolyl isomerase n=1 Tax=Flavobacterium lotistagni TaxID=2709660 RepID=UPI00140BD328|nr:peptidylprolyl isomerase [Flavobacterium lotistagni]NHM07763.1 peptidylprolyl isomerase [Flavobacterium lotistagni]